MYCIMNIKMTIFMQIGAGLRAGGELQMGGPLADPNTAKIARLKYGCSPDHPHHHCYYS